MSVRGAAFLIGLLIVAQGLLGLAATDTFVSMVRTMQQPPAIYAAAAVRVAFGIVLFLAAPRSSARHGLRALGALIVIGGLATPFVGAQIAAVILDWWADPAVARAWAGGALVLGAFITWSAWPRRRAQEPA